MSEYKITFSKKVEDILTVLEIERGISRGEVITQSIAMFKYLHDLSRKSKDGMVDVKIDFRVKEQ